MIVCKKWCLCISIFMLLLLSVNCDIRTNQVSVDLKTRQQDDYVDPHSFYYNKHSKVQDRMKPRSSGNGNSHTDLAPFSKYPECDRLFDECINNKMKDISDEHFSRRIINLLISATSFERNDDSIIGNVVIQVTPSQLQELKSFGLGEISMRDIDSTISKMFKAPEIYLFRDTLSFIKYLLVEAFMHKYIVFGTLLTLWMTWVILTAKWNMMKLITTMLMIVFAASFVITWLQLLKEAEIKHTVKQMLHTELPNHCQPSKMTWIDKIWMIFSISDDCHQYYEAVMDDPFLHVTPAQALSRMIATCFLQPMEMMGHTLGDFVHHSTKHLPYSLRVIIQPLLIMGLVVLAVLALICLAGGSIGWGLGPLTLFSLRGRDRSANSKSIHSTERRAPIEVILNAKITQDGGVRQLVLQTGEHPHNAKVTVAVNNKTENGPVDDINSTPLAEKLAPIQPFPLKEHQKCKSEISNIEELEINPAGGDSIALNTTALCDECKKTYEPEMEASTAGSGSGDN